MTRRGAMPKCRHCTRAIVACITRPLPHSCPPGSHGYLHYGTGEHRCQPQAPTTYAQAAGSGDG